MDGTLLNDEHRLNQDFWEMEKALHENGIIFSIASGRQYFNLESMFEPIKDRMLFFAENGTHVVYKGEELYVNPLEKEAAHKFIETAREMEDVEIVLCGKKSAYLECRDEKFVSEIRKYYKKIEFVDDLKEVEDTFLKLTICDWRGVESHSYHTFKQFENDYKVAIAAKIFIDITSLTANKGNAIKKVQEKLDISPDETLVFGDYLNDLEMVQNATHSYAMKNAHSEILKVSNYVTSCDNNNNGVLKTILDLGLCELKDKPKESYS